MFQPGSGPNTSTGSNGIVVVVDDVDVDDVEAGEDVVVVGPYGTDVVVILGTPVVVVVDVQSVVVVVLDSVGLLDVGGPVSSGGSVATGGSVGGGSVGGGADAGGSVEGGGAWAPENAPAPPVVGANAAAMTRLASSRVNERVARRVVISRLEPEPWRCCPS